MDDQELDSCSCKCPDPFFNHPPHSAVSLFFYLVYSFIALRLFDDEPAGLELRSRPNDWGTALAPLAESSNPTRKLVLGIRAHTPPLRRYLLFLHLHLSVIKDSSYFSPFLP